MKYIKLFEKFKDWNTLSDAELASAQELHQIGVVSDKELDELYQLRDAEWKILQYTGVGNLNLRSTTLLKSLPSGLKIDQNLFLGGCTGLESLPAGLRVGGNLSLYSCKSLESLPADLVVGGLLDLTDCTGLKSLPADLMVGGKIYR